MYEYYRECFFDYIIGESVDDYLCEAETTIGNDNMIRTMRNFKRAWKPALTKYKRSIKERDLSRAERYHKECARLLHNLGKVMSELDYELTNSDALLGTMSSMLKNVAYGIYGLLAFNKAHGSVIMATYRTNPEMASKMAKNHNKAAVVTGAAVLGAGMASDIHAIATSIKAKKASGGKLSLHEFNVERAKLIRQYQKLVKAFDKVARAHQKMLKASESSQPKNTESKNDDE